MPFIEVPQDLCCSIDSEIFTDPVITKSGDSYSRKSIERWFVICDEKKLPATSPATNEVLTSRELTPNRDLNSRVSKFRESLLTGKALQTVIESGDVKTLESRNVVKSELNGTLFEVGDARVPALILAALNKRLQMVRWLLPYVDINARSAANNTTLMALCGSSAEWIAPMVALLLEAKAEVNSPKGWSALHMAVSYNPSCVKILLANGANVNDINPQGRTPLLCCKQIETVKQLVTAGADLFAVDLEGQSVLFHARDPKFFTEMYEFMRETGGAGKLLTAYRSTKNQNLTVPIVAGGSLRPALIPAILNCMGKDWPRPYLLNSLWFGLVQSHHIASSAAARSRDSNRQKHQHPLIKTNMHSFRCAVCRELGRACEVFFRCTVCKYSECESCFNYKTRESIPDAVECIRVLVDYGLAPFSTLDSEGDTLLHRLINRTITLATKEPLSSDELQSMNRVILTMVRAGASLTIKDKSGKTPRDLMMSSSHIMWGVFELALPFFDCKQAVDSKVGAVLSSVSAAAASSDSMEIHSKRAGGESNSGRPIKRSRNAETGTEDTGNISSSSSAAAAASVASVSLPKSASAAASEAIAVDD